MDEGSNPRVVVLFPGALGDLLLAMPTLVQLRARHAGEPFTLVVSGWLQPLAATSGVADAIASLDDADAAGLFGGDRLPSWMRGRPRVYSWIGSRDPEVGARLRSLASHLELAGVVRGDGAEHATVAYARQVGVPAAGRFSCPPLPVTARLRKVVAGLRGPILAVHPGAGSPAKRWAHAGFATVAARWRAAGGAVVEIVGPADRALAPVAGERVVDWSLPEVGALLGHIDAYVGNDSGVTHLAAAAGAPGVAIYGPTAACRWAPLGGRVLAIQADGACVDGIDTSAVTPDRVWSALAPCCSAGPPHRRT